MIDSYGNELTFRSKEEIDGMVEDMIRKDDACPECNGTGEVSQMEYVYPGEPHMADTGTRPCICKLRDPDDYDEE
jgi:hypothetical protein